MRRLVVFALLSLALLGGAPIARAQLPTPPLQPGDDPYDYTRLHITNGSCAGVPAGQREPATSDLPPGFDCRRSTKLSDYAAVPGDSDYDPTVALNPQELFGKRGPGTNRAWEVTTGRPDTVIAVTDSGIRWDEDRPELLDKFALNPGELPVPGTDTKGGTARDHDVNGDGIFSVADYANDPRAVDSPDDSNTVVDPGDLIRAFSDGVDDDGNGYTDDISGWDFFEGDNDPNDDVDYGHGTGESGDSAAEATASSISQCPNCRLLEMRVGDSFVADSNHFAEAAVYAADNGASIIQSALGALNHTGFAQRAVDYAYAHGVLFVASAADEAAGHHNQPSALDHAMVVNSLTHWVDPIQAPKTWLAFNGCTNFGAYIWVSVESNSCSSDAVGQTAGMAGLLYSAARNAVEQGVIAPDASGKPISAEEAKQLFRVAADDVDFSSPKPPGPPNNFVTTLPASQRYVTTAGWDQITGFGRSNADAMVHLVEAGDIPPEADITSPRGWETLPAKGTVDVVGRIAAPRAPSYTYEVAVAPGVQPPRWPLSDTWTTVASGSGTSAKSGVLATLDLAAVHHAIASAPPVYLPTDDPTSTDLPEKDAFRVRVLVHADGDTTTPWKTAIAQREAFAHDDPSLLPGWPRWMDADGASSAAFDDLDADGIDELVIGDGNGYVHAFHADGSEAAGWPQHTPAIPLPTTGKNGFTSGAVTSTVYGALLTGAPLVADLDGDGAPEVAVGDIEGNLLVWHHDGTAVAGFPVRGIEAYSHEMKCEVVLGPRCDDNGAVDARDHLNTVDQAFSSMPAAGDLDPTVAGRELVASSNDGHVYAWHDDGTPVAGWPVLLRDPAKVAAVEPVSHRVTYTDGADAHFGRKILSTPALGDVDGDGYLDVAVNVNEEYGEPPATSDPTFAALGLVKPAGNTRTYVLFHDGTAHPATPAQQATPHPDDQAYLPGWPVKVAMVALELLPYVGEGSNGTPALADVDGDGKLEVFTASIGSPPYLFRADGSSYYGTSNGQPKTGSTLVPGLGSTATDLPSFPSLGGGVFGRLGGPGSPLSYAMGASGARRLLDVVLPEQQLLAEDHVSAWRATTGSFEAGFPARMNDLQFLATPAIADVDGDGKADVVAASAMYDVRAYGLGGLEPAGWPKQTSGWSVATPGLGDVDGDGALEVVVPDRDGRLFVWHTAGAACQAIEWPQRGHDPTNSSNYQVDGRRPGIIRDLTVTRRADGQLLVHFEGTGDDGACGEATGYRVAVDGVTTEVAGGAGPHDVVVATPPGERDHATVVSVQGVDDAGNAGYRSSVALAGPLLGRSDDGAAPVAVLPATGGGTDSIAFLLLAVALAGYGLSRKDVRRDAGKGRAARSRGLRARQSR